jgi:Fibronectin type III domain
MRWSHVGILIAASLSLTSTAQQPVTGDLTLAWDAATDNVTVGYRLGYGTTSHNYTQQIEVGNVTEYTVHGLAFGQQYYFAVRAYSATGQLSAYSAEVAAIVYHIATPLTVGMSATLAPPQPGGTSIVWTAVASSGTAPHEFRWGVFDGTTWSVMTRWEAAATFTWQPTVAGDYVVHVWTRSAREPTVEATTSTPFAITKRCTDPRCG